MTIPTSTDVLVVGAGPAGSAAATWAARAGADVVLADAAVFPRDKTCGDGLTPRAIGELQRLGLEDWLRANAIDTITVVGYMTHNCDLSTIIHAVHMGFAVEFLSDATGSVPYANSAGYASAEEIHRVVTIILQSRFAAVLKTAEWVECLNSGTLPERDTIFGSNQRALARNAA